MSKANPIYNKVKGSPYQPQDNITIIGFSDETEEKIFIGSNGIIKYLEYSCGCGQSYPCDPMIGIILTNGYLIECWKEEITKRRYNEK